MKLLTRLLLLLFPRLSAALFAGAAILHAAAAPLPALRVSDDQRFLITADGKPFFWLADTAWQLIHDLNEAETRRYLADRRDKGFTVIQTVALAEHHRDRQTRAETTSTACISKPPPARRRNWRNRSTRTRRRSRISTRRRQITTASLWRWTRASPGRIIPAE